MDCGAIHLLFTLHSTHSDSTTIVVIYRSTSVLSVIESLNPNH
jgi:hypothetical protein